MWTTARVRIGSQASDWESFGKQGMWFVSLTACIPTTLMVFAECDIAINFANADSTEHCLTDSELRATHGHVEEGIWAD